MIVARVAFSLALAFTSASTSKNVALSSPAVAAEPSLVADGKGPKRRVVALDAKRARAVYKVNAAPGLATVIEMPEGWARTPTCGDCVFGDQKPDGQLWRLDVFPETRTISIKPTRLPGPDMPASAFVTNVDVALAGGIAITLFVELSVPENADARVEFSLDAAEMESAKLTKLERELEDKFDERVKRASTDALLAAAMKGTTCREFWGRPTRAADVVVRLKQLCKNSVLVYVTFEVENRRRDDVHLVAARLDALHGEAEAGDQLEKRALRFNERGYGIAAVAVGDVDRPERFKLTVTADGIDAPTKIVVEDISL